MILLLLLIASLIQLIQTQINTTAVRDLSNIRVLLPNSYFVVNDKLQIHFNFETNETITMAFVLEFSTSFLGIGFGTSMTNTDMWTFEIVNDAVIANDYYSFTQEKPKPDSVLNGTSDLKLVDWQILSNRTVIKVNRKLSTGDFRDVNITQGSNNMVYSYNPASKTLRYHTKPNRGAIIAPLFQNSTSLTVENIAFDYKYKDIHAFLMIFGWGVVYDISIIIVRIFKGKTKYPPYQIIHMVFMLISMTLTLASSFYMFQHAYDFRTTLLPYEDNNYAHSIIGIVVLAMSFVSTLSGLLSYCLIRNPKTDENQFRYRMFHAFWGLTIYTLSRAQMILGAFLMDSSIWINTILPYIALSLMLQLFVSLKHNIKAKKKYYVTISTNVSNESHRLLLQKLDQGWSRAKIIEDLPDLRWVLFGDAVIDLTGWVHPGGNFAIESALGRDVSRFLFGAYPLEHTSKMKAYTHSSFALQLVEKFCIGRIHTGESLILNRKTMKQVASNSNFTWNIVSKTRIFKSFAKFEFKCDQFMIKPYGKGTTWFGRHYNLQQANVENGPIRMYTQVMCMTDEAILLRELVMDALENSKDLIVPPKCTACRKTLPLYMRKYYNETALSKAIFEVNLKNKFKNAFTIEGPIGRGIEIPHDLSGNILILVGGSGILPFLDFFNYLYLKTAHEIFKEQSKENTKVIESLGINFENKWKSVSVKFFGAFENKDNIIGLELLSKLAKLSGKFKKKIFEARIIGYQDEYIKEQKGRFDAVTIKRMAMASANLIYVCGPPRFNKEIPEILLELGVNRERIFLV